MEKKEIHFDLQTGLVDRKYTKEWSNSGFINIDNVPKLIDSIVHQRKEMILYIEALHDKLDFIMKRNNICDISDCHTAGCTSDHK
jgi:hypothetical protein